MAEKSGKNGSWHLEGCQSQDQLKAGVIVSSECSSLQGGLDEVDCVETGLHWSKEMSI